MPTRVLGLSAYYHDAAAALLEDGRIVAAAQEERFTRRKHDPGFPSNAVNYCLREAGIRLADVDHVAFYEKPLIKFDRLLSTYFGSVPRGYRSYLAAMPVWLGEKLWQADELREQLPEYEGEILFGYHHESHAASAFYPSPFEEAAVITIDGVGEWATSSIGAGRGHQLDLLMEQRFPHSLGLLYSAFTYFTGFRVNSGEYKVMGLAPYGRPTYVQTIRDHLVDIRDDGSVWMNMEYFTYPYALTMTGRKFERLFGGPARSPESALTQREMDLARSVQEVTETAMLAMARHAQRQTGLRRVCLAGGVALNCVGNGHLLREGIFDDVWIQPAAGDAGGALGVALAVWHRHLGMPRVSCEAAGTWQPSTTSSSGTSPRPYADAMQGSFLGPRPDPGELTALLATPGVHGERIGPRDLPTTVARLLADEQVIGLVQGRMEFGPRALGGRSIIGDARSPKMQSMMNLKIKFRESFRPFAPAILREHVADWFALDTDSPYMLLVADVAEHRRVAVPEGAANLGGNEQLAIPRSTIPAVTHVDGSARVQTVRHETNPVFHDILQAFFQRTGCPVLVNTSFNVRGEPIVCTPADAYRCFMRTNMDALVIDDCLFLKSGQSPLADDGSWRREFALD